MDQAERHEQARLLGHHDTIARFRGVAVIPGVVEIIANQIKKYANKIKAQVCEWEICPQCKRRTVRNAGRSLSLWSSPDYGSMGQYKEVV